MNAAEIEPVDAVRALCPGGVDYSFEAIGRRVTVEQAFSMLAPGGVATVLGMVPDDEPLRITASELFFQEKRLQGSLLGRTNSRPIFRDWPSCTSRADSNSTR